MTRVASPGAQPYDDQVFLCVSGRCEAMELHDGGPGGEERRRHGAARVCHDTHQQGKQNFQM